VDGRVVVEVNGEVVLVSSAEQYPYTPEIARKLAENEQPPRLHLAAEDVAARVAGLLIERDVYYTSDPSRAHRGRPANAGTGNPFTIGPDEYFCCGDNSPNSLDGRYWYNDMLGPHLRAAAEAGRYTVGTVPADQMIGRAFFVYWPGFLPITPWGPNILPDVGRARWIH
jgi:hypothetical protein